MREGSGERVGWRGGPLQRETGATSTPGVRDGCPEYCRMPGRDRKGVRDDPFKASGKVSEDGGARSVQDGERGSANPFMKGIVGQARETGRNKKRTQDTSRQARTTEGALVEQAARSGRRAGQHGNLLEFAISQRADYHFCNLARRSSGCSVIDDLAPHPPLIDRSRPLMSRLSQSRSRNDFCAAMAPAQKLCCRASGRHEERVVRVGDRRERLTGSRYCYLTFVSHFPLGPSFKKANRWIWYPHVCPIE